MSLYDDASLIMYPSGYKSGKIYCQKPTDGSGDLTFTRASTATRVNENGLIEAVASGVPRIDFTGGGCGKLLLEPQRTNNVLQSNQFDTTWLNQLGGSITGGQTNTLSATADAWKLTKDAAVARSIRQVITLGSATYCYSAYIKAGTLTKTTMRVDTSTGARRIDVDLINGVVTGTFGSIVSSSVEDWSNGWWRCVMVITDTVSNIHIYAGDFSDATAGDIYCQRVQLEEGTYPTSYIPTSGTAVTRVDDAASVTVPSGTLKITETFGDDTTNVITSIPATYTATVKPIKNVIMSTVL